MDKAIRKHFDVPTYLLIITITINLVVAALVYRDFGLTWDEPLFYQYGDAVGYAYSITARLSPDFDIEHAYGPSATDHKIYGPAYLLIGGFIRKLLGFFLTEELWSLWRLVNFGFFQVSLLVLYLFSRRWIDSWAAFAATVFMAYQPLLWGMAFINPKDMPFLGFFIFTLATGMGMVWRLTITGKTEFPLEESLSQDAKRIYWRIIQVVLAVLAVCSLVFIVWLYSDANDSVIARTITAVYNAPSKSIVRKIAHLFEPINNDIPVESYINEGLKLFFTLQSSLGFIACVLLFFSVVVALLPFFPSLLCRLDHHFLSHFRLPTFKKPHTNDMRQTILRWLIVVIFPATLLGILTSIRVLGPLAGLFVIGYFLVRKERRSWWPIIFYLIIAIFSLWITWPYLWDSPLVRMIEVVKHMANNPQILPVLFNYQVYLSNQLPGIYMPVVMAITLTEPVWFLFLGGLAISIKRMIKNSLNWRSFIWILAWFMIPTLYVILLKPPMYDGFRHFLFVLPPVFLISGLAFQWLIKLVKYKWIYAVICFTVVLPGIWGIIQTHPYEYAYYNSFIGGMKGAFRRFETDYWLTCYKELVPQLNDYKESASGRLTLYVLRQPANAQYYALDGIDVQRYEPDDPQFAPGDFLLLTTRSNMDLIHQPEAPDVLQVDKNGAVLCVIKQIP